MARRSGRVGDVMSRPPVTVGRNRTLREAEDRMRQRGIRHLLVLDGEGELCGVISHTDLFRGALLKALGFGSRAEERLLDSLLVKEAMSEDLCTITTTDALAAAARLMIERQIGCLPVLEEGALVGVLTETDFVRLASGEGG